MDQQESYKLRHGGPSAPSDKGTVTYAIREYIIPIAVFVAMILWLAKNIIIPIVKDPQMVPAYTGWSGARRIEVVDAEDDDAQDEPSTKDQIEEQTSKSKKTK
eukprot:GILI01031026.1.p1 GENE.GILI01031026.1~~GILI01031026.1.p1  ORF type:complete len:103 (-),score=20.66 GILI01031026.1:35-343(-)